MMTENSSAPPIYYLCTRRSWTLDNVEYLHTLGIIQLVDFYKQLMHRLGVVADDDDNNKMQAGQFSYIGKFRYVCMADDSCILHRYIPTYLPTYIHTKGHMYNLSLPYPRAV